MKLSPPIDPSRTRIHQRTSQASWGQGRMGTIGITVLPGSRIRFNGHRGKNAGPRGGVFHFSLRTLRAT